MIEVSHATDSYQYCIWGVDEYKRITQKIWQKKTDELTNNIISVIKAGYAVSFVKSSGICDRDISSAMY